MANPVVLENAKRVLLVDPDDAFGNVLEEVLGAEGYSIRQVLSPDLAAGELENGLSDVVLLNIDRWNQDSQGTRQLLRSAADLPVSIPIISFGWAKHSKAALEVFQHGALDFLEQPLDIQELKFAVNRACRRSEMAR